MKESVYLIKLQNREKLLIKVVAYKRKRVLDKIAKSRTVAYKKQLLIKESVYLIKLQNREKLLIKVVAHKRKRVFDKIAKSRTVAYKSSCL